jgi:hypothetical protein
MGSGFLAVNSTGRMVLMGLIVKINEKENLMKSTST